MVNKNIIAEYEGALRVQMVHTKSGSRIHTDAPIDNKGKGEAFSPTDLVAAAAVSCVLTIAGIHYQEKGIELKSISCSVQKVMYGEPRRIGELIFEFDFGENNFTEKDSSVFRRIVKHCPVTDSLNPAIKIKTNL